MSKAFTDQLKSLLKRNQIQINKFWINAEEKENAYYFALKIYQTIVTESKQYTNELERMYSTLLVLQYFQNTKEKPAKLLDQCRNLIVSNKAERPLNYVWILSMFLENSKQTILFEGFIKRLAKMPQNFIVDQHFLKRFENDLNFYENVLIKNADITKKNYQMLNVSSTADIAPVTFTYSYMCFLDHILTKDLVVNKEIYIEIIQSLRYLLDVSRVSTKADNPILCVLHLLQNLIRFYVLPQNNIIKELMLIIEVYKKMPFPIGELAQQLMQMLYLELKTTGYNYRQYIRLSIPNLDSFEEKELNHVAYFVGLDKNYYKKQEFCSLDTVRKFLVCNMISINSQKEENIYLKIANLTSKTIFNYYGRLLKILEICEQLDNIEDVKKMQQKTIKEVVQRIMTEKSDRNRESSSKELEEFYKNKKYYVFEYPEFQIIHLNINNLVNLGMADQNLRDLLASKSTEYQYHAPKFKIIFQGNDSQFRKIVQVIGEIFAQDNGNLLDHLEIYILPPKKQKFQIAKYLASQDIWYQQFIYNVFRGNNSLFPEYIPSDTNKNVLPHLLFEKSIQMYLREGLRLFTPKVFRCDIKYGNGAKKRSQRIYFCQHIYMGLTVYIENYRKSKQKYEDLDFLEIYLEKLKKQERPAAETTIDIQIDTCDFTGRPLHREVENDLRIHDFRICKYQTDYNFGNTPNPTNSILELTFLHANNAKAFQKEITNKNMYKITHKQLVSNVRSYFSTCSFVSTKIFAKNGNTKLIIDGTLFEQVESFEIGEVINMKKDGKQLKLPIKAFLPFKI